MRRALASSADRPLTRSRAATRSAWIRAISSRDRSSSRSPLEELPLAFLEEVGALVELGVAGEEAPLEGGELGPLRPGLLFGLLGEPELGVLRFEDEVLLAFAGLGDDPLRFGLGGPDGLGRPDPGSEDEPDADPDGADDERRHEGDRNLDHDPLSSAPAAVGRSAV